MRTWIIAVALFVMLPAGAFAQSKTTALGGMPNQLAPDEYERLMKRVEGTWILNRAKSTLMSGDTLGVPEGYVYKLRPDRKGVYFTGSRGTSMQMYDGKPYAYGEKNTIARLPIDEYTIDNITGADGKRRGRNTQVYSADGSKAVYIVRRIDANGVETVISSVLFEKVPEGTPIPKPPSDPGFTGPAGR